MNQQLRHALELMALALRSNAKELEATVADMQTQLNEKGQAWQEDTQDGLDAQEVLAEFDRASDYLDLCVAHLQKGLDV